MPVQAWVCCVPDRTSPGLSSVASQPRRADSVAPLHRWRPETSGDGSPLQSGLGDCNPGTQSGPTPSPQCKMSAWEAQRNGSRWLRTERVRAPANTTSQTLDFPLFLFCSKSGQPALTEPNSEHVWEELSPVTVTLTGFAGTESSVCARLSAALIMIIALTAQAIKALGVCGHVCPN